MDMERWNISSLNRLGIITSYGMRQFKASLLLLAKSQSDRTIRGIYPDNDVFIDFFSPALSAFSRVF